MKIDADTRFRHQWPRRTHASVSKPANHAHSQLSYPNHHRTYHVVERYPVLVRATANDRMVVAKVGSQAGEGAKHTFGITLPPDVGGIDLTGHR